MCHCQSFNLSYFVSISYSLNGVGGECCVVFLSVEIVAWFSFATSARGVHGSVWFRFWPKPKSKTECSVFP